MDKSVTKSFQFTLIFVIILSSIVSLMGRVTFALGILAGSLWAMFNFWLLIRLLEVAVCRESKKRLAFMLVLKFPILYFAGFVILISKCFPVTSLLVGLVAAWVLGGLLSLCQKRRQ